MSIHQGKEQTITHEDERSLDGLYPVVIAAAAAAADGGGGYDDDDDDGGGGGGYWKRFMK
jgi:hypothetical protein